jgi:drug/metabolite transporter (DMT)-like permease
MQTKLVSIIYAILAALCYGISIPISKILLENIPPVFIAGLLYIGGGMGMLLIKLIKKENLLKEAKLTKNEMPYVIGMVILDVLAPIFLMLGLAKTTAATASLLNNFEIVATSVIALIIFKETIGRKTWIAIVFITIASVILSVEDFSFLTFSFGAIFVLLACICWGLENNCTCKLSVKDPLEIVIIKGIASGLTSIIIALILKQHSTNIKYIAITLLLGFIAIGLSVYFYIYAQRTLGAARTSAYYAFAPFIGVGLSFIIFKESLTVSYIIALVIMIIGVGIMSYEKHKHYHFHGKLGHEHRHSHNDVNHNHEH